jgi:hypothetical protein
MRRRNATNFLRLGLPFRAHRNRSAGVLRGSDYPHEICLPLQRRQRGGPRIPGFQPRCVPPSGFPTLLTVYSLQRLPTTRVGTTPGVRPPEPFPPAKPDAGWHPDPHAVHDIASFCSEDQKATMPRSFRAVIPAGIRTPSRPKSGEGRCSPEISRHPKGKDPKLERIRVS